MRFLPPPVLGSIAFVIFSVNTVFWCSLLFIATAVKLILPFPAARKVINPVLTAIAECWVGGNRLGLWLTQRIEWDFQVPASLSRKGAYFVASNHQTWVDIVALQLCFNRRIPLLRFFVKKELFKVPVLGLAWWALDFPFMQRYSKEFLARNPQLKGKDLETVKKACEKFRGMPVSILNFVEGTRFTREKHERQKSPYKRLLIPKAGGTAAALTAMGDALHSMLDVTILYPGRVPTFWDLISGRVPRVLVRVQERPIPDEFRHGDYEADPGYRERFQAWLHQIWQEKDAQLEKMAG